MLNAKILFLANANKIKNNPVKAIVLPKKSKERKMIKVIKNFDIFLISIFFTEIQYNAKTCTIAVELKEIVKPGLLDHPGPLGTYPVSPYIKCLNSGLIIQKIIINECIKTT
jgi:hypothetical protein